VHPDGTTVVLAGSVVPATQALAAGQEALVRTRTQPWGPGGWRLTLTFREDGTLRRTTTSPKGEPYALDGTWEMLSEDRLRLTFRTPGTTAESRVEARVERVGADLHLTFDERPCTSQPASCLEWREREFGMPPGTLADLREGRTLVFAPGAPG
jgi:hypothetical protein